MPAKREKVINALAAMLDETLNPGAAAGQDRKLGFVLLVFPFGKWGRCNYISNVISHRDVARIFRELADQFDQREARKDGPGGVM